MRPILASIAVALLVVASASLRAQEACQFIRGEINNLDGLDIVDLNDAVDILAYLYLGVSVPACPDAADINDNGLVEPSDYTYLVDFLLGDGPPPPAPFPEAGVDPTPGTTLPAERDPRFRFTLGSGAGVPSNTGVELPLTFTSTEPVTGIQAVLRYNDPEGSCPTLLIQEIRTEEGTLLSAQSSEYIIAEFDNAKGVAFIAALKDFASPFHFQSGEDPTLPAGQDQLLGTLVVAVSSCSDMGFAPIRFEDGPKLPDNHLADPALLAEGHNLVFLDGTAVRPELAEGGGIDVRRGFIRGDSNKDDSVDIGDPVFLLNYIFQAGAVPPCLDSADANNDTRLDISDPIYLLGYLFTGGPQPSEPFPQAGVDPSDDGRGSLGCDSDRL